MLEDGLEEMSPAVCLLRHFHDNESVLAFRPFHGLLQDHVIENFGMTDQDTLENAEASILRLKDDIAIRQPGISSNERFAASRLAGERCDSTVFAIRATTLDVADFERHG
jgi:hypothetical protein